MSVHPLLRGVVWSSCLVLLATVPAAAQTLEGSVSSLNAGFEPSSIATGRNGDVLVVGETNVGGFSRTLRYVASSYASGESFALGDVAAKPAVTAVAHGGFAAAWMTADQSLPTDVERVYVAAQRLSSKGEPLGTSVPASDLEFNLGRPGIASAGLGFAVGWRRGSIFHQLFDPTGVRIDGPFDGGPEGIASVRMTGLADGGFLMVWGRDDTTEARRFDAAGAPLSPRFTVASTFEPTGVAVNPAGTFAAVVGKATPEHPNPGASRLRFFATDGSYVSGDIELGGSTPGVACDAGGNFLVTFGLQTVFGPALYAEAFDPTGTPFRPAVALHLSGVYGTVVTARREGGFFAVWNSPGSPVDKVHGASVTLCTPGSAVCGDGTLVSTCEVCDDGAANSDTVPDACRTDCRRPRCGDGVVDGGEQCDDGNETNCDGCDEFCDGEVGVICGDGAIAPPGCAEQCDDGDVSGGDGCSETCKVERIPGGGPALTDCWAAWRIDNPSNTPRFDKRGAVNPKQACTDGDPACDFDDVDGACTFHLAVCVNNSQPFGCTPSRLVSWTLASPSAKQALTRPALAAVRAALDAAVLPTVVGSSDPNVCSTVADVVVPLRGGPGAYKANKLKLKSRAGLYGGEIDTDTLQLRCNPS